VRETSLLLSLYLKYYFFLFIYLRWWYLTHGERETEPQVRCLETSRKGKRKQVADTQRPSSVLHIASMDDYLNRGRHDASQGHITPKNLRDDTRAEEGEGSRDNKGRGTGPVGSYRIRCGLIFKRRPGNYPCFSCPGGLDFEWCKKIREG